MSAKNLRRGMFLVCFVLAGSVLGFAQGTPLQVGPLTVTVPPGWTAQANGDPVRIFSPDSTLQQYLQVDVFAPQQITQSVREYHSVILQRMSAMIPPGSPQQNGVLGKFIWTRFVMQRPGGQPEAMILYSAKTGSLYLGITVDATNPELLSRNLPALEAMVRGATIGDAPPASGPSAPPPDAVNSSGAQANVPGPATLGEYVFATPPGWNATRHPDGIVLDSPVSVTNEKCFITLWPMRPAGPNLLGDANNVFREVWGQYELRNRDMRGGDMPPSIIRGTSGQGWDYVIVKRGIGPRGSPETRLGFVFVAKLNDRLAVISGLSKDPLVSTCFGELAHNAWPGFFYSLSFKNWPPTDQAAAMRRRIAGVWIGGGATAADRFVFAANGRYGGASASQQYNVLSSREVLETTTAFFGDGAYTLRGNTITLTPDNRKRPENGFIRLEEESKDEGRSWVETLYLLRTSEINGEQYEMAYHRSR